MKIVKKYTVLGMSCSACSSSVERVVKRIDGVTDAVVSLSSKLLTITASKQVEDDLVIKAIKKAGFEGSVYVKER